MTNNPAENHIRPDLKVGALARLAFEIYFKDPDPEEILRLQNGDFCHRTFRIKRTMPVLKRIDEIETALAGTHSGERGFYDVHYWKKVYSIDGVKYRVVNDWHEPPNPLDNRAPLEDWIRRMDLVL